MDNNNVTVQAVLDTTRLRKDLEKFKGEISLSAVTKPMLKQIDGALKDASKNASITLTCNATGLNAISSQVDNAKSQIQSLQQTLSALPSNLNINVSVNSSGLQQYMTQLEKALQQSNSLSTISLQSVTPKVNISDNTSSTATSFSTETSALSKATAAGESFLDVLSKIKNTTGLFSSFIGTENITKTFKDMGTNLTKNLD